MNMLPSWFEIIEGLAKGFVIEAGVIAGAVVVVIGIKLAATKFL